MSTTLSPAQAAQAVQVSRRTITRAINAKTLRATRDNKNQWRIWPEDLEAWRAAQTAQWAPTGHAQEDAHSAHLDAHSAAHPNDDLRREVTELRVEARSLRERLMGLEQQLTEEKEARRLAEERHHAQVLALAQRPVPERPQEAPTTAMVVEPSKEPPLAVEQLRKRLEEAKAHKASLAAPEKPQEAPVAKPVVEVPPKAPGFLARLLGRG